MLPQPSYASLCCALSHKAPDTPCRASARLLPSDGMVRQHTAQAPSVDRAQGHVFIFVGPLQTGKPRAVSTSVPVTNPGQAATNERNWTGRRLMAMECARPGGRRIQGPGSRAQTPDPCCKFQPTPQVPGFQLLIPAVLHPGGFSWLALQLPSADWQPCPLLTMSSVFCPHPRAVQTNKSSFQASHQPWGSTALPVSLGIGEGVR